MKRKMIASFLLMVALASTLSGCGKSAPRVDEVGRGAEVIAECAGVFNAAIVNEDEQNGFSSDEMLTESEAIKLLRERGFEDFEVTYDYTESGDIIYPEESANIASDEKHPCYYTYYMSPEGEYWTILVTGKTILANPVRYNLELNDTGVQVVYGESKIVTQYLGDGILERVEPGEKDLTIQVVERIDANTLNQVRFN